MFVSRHDVLCIRDGSAYQKHVVRWIGRHASRERMRLDHDSCGAQLLDKVGGGKRYARSFLFEFRMGNDICQFRKRVLRKARRYSRTNEIVHLARNAAAKESGEPASPVIREEDARAYLAALRYDVLQNKEASPDTLNRLASLLLIYNARSAGFDSVVRQIAAVGERTVERARAAPALAEGTLSPVFLFSLDSGFFPLFLGHSPLAVGTQVIPKGPDSASLPTSSYLLYSQLPLRGETEESIASDLQFFFGEGLQ